MNNKIIDLRSDTLTKPSIKMLEYMMQAKVGDDVYSEDPTVNELENLIASLLGKESALFVPTGVMGNQLCLKVLSNPGDEVILGYDSHIFNYETAAPSLLSGIQLHTIPNFNGSLNKIDVLNSIRENEYYLPKTSVICLEQTHNKSGGKVVPIQVICDLSEIAKSNNISLHLDGARLWNASVASNISLKSYAQFFDTVSVCLSKGLGAPIGSVISSTKENIIKAKKYRKIWGGGWRQAGILAAAGIYAVENNFQRLKEDHNNTKEFANLISINKSIKLISEPETNILIFEIEDIDPYEFCKFCKEQGLLLSSAFKGKLRAVFYKDVSSDDVFLASKILLESINNYKR